MGEFSSFGKKLQNLCISSGIELACLNRSFRSLIASSYRFLVFSVHLLWIQLCYFVGVSVVGFVVLKVLKPRTGSIKPKDLDMFFMSVSATTVSSMSTVEMEVFSNNQLIILNILMVLGGEVFVSLIGLRWLSSTFKKHEIENKVDSVGTHHSSSNIELGLVSLVDLESENSGREDRNVFNISDSEDFRLNSIRYLGYVICGYFLGIHIIGVTLILVYLSLVPSARNVLKNKGLHMLMFSVFTTVSTSTNCGFIPINENMMVFNKNSGLLLLLIPQALLGNTLYPPCLRFLIWVLGKVTRREEFNYLLKNSQDIRYKHLVPYLHSCLLIVTVIGFIMVQFMLFCCMEWNSEALKGLDSYQKLVAALFQSVNSRHTGESVVDLSIISPAILVLYVLMMYIPPFTTFWPIKNDERCPISCEKGKRRMGQLVDNIVFSRLAYLVIFIILICITERKQLKEDPLNFNVMNIVVEVISAYGNVGFSTGYSCGRQLKPDGYCKDAWYGFSGRWSNTGKLVLIFVMFFGRLKKFNMEGGKAWKLL